jgi:hypothetical protein
MHFDVLVDEAGYLARATIAHLVETCSACFAKRDMIFGTFDTRQV